MARMPVPLPTSAVGKAPQPTVPPSVPAEPPTAPDREPAPSRQPPPEEEGKRFVVRKLVIANVQVDFDLLPAGGQLTRAKATIPRIVLEDLGNTEDGATMAELASAVVQALLQASLEAGGQVLSPALLDDLRASLEALGDLPVQLEGVRAELETIDEALGTDLGEQLDEALKDAGGSLDDLLKRQ